MMKGLFFLLVLVLFSLAGVFTCQSSPSIGFVKTITGDVSIGTSSGTEKAFKNMKIEAGDFIKTGSVGSVGLIFNDDTVVSLGPLSEMIIEEFYFNPADNRLSFMARIVKGTFTFISGQIAKLAPQRVRIETPDATLGVRGTKFLVKVD